MIKNVTEYLERSAELYPDKIALEDKNGTLTFRQLKTAVCLLAGRIQQQWGTIQNKPIAVEMKKSKECIVSFLGIAYSGNFYCPIPSNAPQERRSKILDVLNPVGFIGKKSDGLPNGNSFIDIEILNTHNADAQGYIPPANSVDTDPLYVLFTSGSTGIPKGVLISHRSVIDYTEWLADEFNFDTTTVFGNQAPFYFDNSILDIYSMLRNGSRMVIIPEEKFLLQNELMQYIEQKEINTLFWVPSALIGVANAGILNEFRSLGLKNILFCGEVMPNKHLNMWRDAFPNADYANLYGPTEITDACCFYHVERIFSDEEPLPIGKACKNTNILVLNEQNQLVKEGETGELCVRGTCLALGYYGDLARTNAAFTQNPLHNLYPDKIYHTGDLVYYNNYKELMFVGRKDYQIKLQGHRIELGEIEAAMLSISEIQTACVIFLHEEKKIHAFYSGTASLMEVYKALQKKLPRYMLPCKIHLLETLPYNINSKIDRKRLQTIAKNILN